MAIIAACFLAMMAVISNTTIGNIRIDASTTSSLLARGKMAEVLARPFDEVANVSLTNFSSPFGGYSYRVTVNYADLAEPNTAVVGPTDLKKVDVEVTYAGLSGGVHIYDLKASMQ